MNGSLENHKNHTILINLEGDIIKQIGQLYLWGILQSSCDKNFRTIGRKLG